MQGQLDGDIEMTAEEFGLIRDFIHERSGIFFPENKMYLVKNRLARRMEDLQIKTVRDYFYHVKYDLSLKEFHRLMDLVTTNETSFFRNEPQLQCFSDEALPLVINEQSTRKGNRTLRIWSAGCSTGEEPYTLAIIILERLRNAAGWNIEIVANDISEQVLQKARLGEYSGITMRGVRPDLLARYFSRSGDSYRVNPEVKALVKFSHMNLNDSRKLAMVSGMDMVFCRNVMIYFSDDVKRQIVRGFYNALRPGGYLFIGHSETLHGISKAFKLVYFKNALVYQKEAAAVTTAEPARQAPCTVRTAASPLAARSTSAADGATRAMELLSKIKPVTVRK
ncbi:MAG: protein-glutamate O-methyltransferase CheR [Candidatus Zixiibacteriota bacterium]